MLIDITRDIGDASGCPIVYASNGALQRVLSAAPTTLLEATRSRIRSSCELPRPSLNDARLLVSELCGVAIDADLIERVFADTEHSTSGLSVRALLRVFEQIETAATAAGRERIALDDWLRLTGEPKPITTASSKRKTPSVMIESSALRERNQEQVA